MDAAIQRLGVSEVAADAFAEYYTAMKIKHAGEPSESVLISWKAELAKCPAEVEIRALLAAHPDAEQIDAKASERIVFSCIYGGRSVADALAMLQSETPSSSPPAHPSFTFSSGHFDARHQRIREVAYPYRPACGSSHGTSTIDCVEADGHLIGYIAVSSVIDGYVDDVAVLPSHHGRGVARGLVCAAAARLVAEGVEELSLHVRACNYPAIRLYESLGLTRGELEFPSWYDWHGGFHMAGNAKAVAAHARSSAAPATAPLTRSVAPLPDFVSLFDSERAARNASRAQSGASNCGETAVRTQLSALRLAEQSGGSVVVRSRDYTTPSLLAYLRSRSNAGCTAADLCTGAASVSGGRATARFFATGPTPPAGLAQWLAEWLALGAAPIVTINTQLDGADYWHHQAVLGVWPREHKILLANPCNAEAEAEVARLLGSESVMLIMLHDVRSYGRGGQGAKLANELDAMRADPTWARLRVAEQVERIWADGEGDGAEGKLTIPASYTPGVTLIAVKGSEAAKRLESAGNGPWRALPSS